MRLLARIHNVFFRTHVRVYLGLAAFTSVALSLKFQKVHSSNYDYIPSLRTSAVSEYPYAPSFLPSTCRSRTALCNTIQSVHQHQLCLRSANIESARVECSRGCYFGDIHLALMSLKSGQICEGTAFWSFWTCYQKEY